MCILIRVCLCVCVCVLTITTKQNSFGICYNFWQVIMIRHKKNNVEDKELIFGLLCFVQILLLMSYKLYIK